MHTGRRLFVSITATLLVGLALLWGLRPQVPPPAVASLAQATPAAVMPRARPAPASRPAAAAVDTAIPWMLRASEETGMRGCGESDLLPTVSVVCTIPGAGVGSVALRGTARIEQHGESRFVLATAVDNKIHMEVPQGTEQHGVIQIPGLSDVRLRFDADGGCVLEDIPTVRAAISGQVVTTAPLADARIAVEGCGGYALVDEEGAFFLEVDAEPCVLHAIRQDGGVTLRGDPLWLEPLPGEEIRVDLALPPWSAAGPGLALEQQDDGVRISAVTPGSPAEEAGLQPCDTLIAIGSEDDLSTLSAWERQDLLSGPAGSALTLTLEDGEQITLERVPLP